MMESKEVLLELRTKNGLSQEDLAEKLYVTRQAVSRWENGETVPNPETLKQLSNEKTDLILCDAYVWNDRRADALICPHNGISDPADHQGDGSGC